MMRTTLMIDDHIAQTLKQNALRSGKPFKQVVNETLSRGLNHRPATTTQPYRVEPSAMGQPKSGMDLIKALQTAEEMQDLETIQELEMRK